MLFKGFNTEYMVYSQQTQLLSISFSLDPWNGANRGGEYANVVYNIDWIKNKLREHKSTNRKSSGSTKFKSHVFILLFIMSGIFLS